MQYLEIIDMQADKKDLNRSQVFPMDLSSETEEEEEEAVETVLMQLFQNLVEEWLETKGENSLANILLNKKVTELNKTKKRKL